MVWRTACCTVTALVAAGGLATAAGAQADQITLIVSGVQGVIGADYHVYGPSSVVGPGDGAVVPDPVDLDGIELASELTTDWNCETIPLLPDGQTYTLVATTGGLTGTLRNLPEGAVASLTRYGHGLCRPRSPMGLQIHYDTGGALQTVTATVVNGSPIPVSYTDVHAEPWYRLQVNQPSTVTATVDVSSGATAGTVSFTAASSPVGGRPLGCPDEYVAVAGGAPATATCEASFSLADMWIFPGTPAPTATFTPDDPSTATGSLGYDLVGVHRGTTTTTLSASRPHKILAKVTPAYLGPTSPTGTVTFLADGAPITGCSAQPLRGDGSPTATCSAFRLNPGIHELTASYLGDDEFDASLSDPLAFTARRRPHAPAPPHTPNPPAPPDPPVPGHTAPVPRAHPRPGHAPPPHARRRRPHRRSHRTRAHRHARGHRGSRRR